MGHIGISIYVSDAAFYKKPVLEPEGGFYYGEITLSMRGLFEQLCMKFRVGRQDGDWAVRWPEGIMADNFLDGGHERGRDQVEKLILEIIREWPNGGRRSWSDEYENECNQCRWAAEKEYERQMATATLGFGSDSFAQGVLAFATVAAEGGGVIPKHFLGAVQMAATISPENLAAVHQSAIEQALEGPEDCGVDIKLEDKNVLKFESTRGTSVEFRPDGEAWILSVSGHQDSVARRTAGIQGWDVQNFEAEEKQPAW